MHKPEPNLFFALPEHISAMDDFNLGVGDVFYDRSNVRFESWGDVIKRPLSVLIVTDASKGKNAKIEYRLDTWDCVQWSKGKTQFTTQSEIKSRIRHE